jgi:hypothetical protein
MIRRLLGARVLWLAVAAAAVLDNGPPWPK